MTADVVCTCCKPTTTAAERKLRHTAETFSDVVNRVRPKDPGSTLYGMRDADMRDATGLRAFLLYMHKARDKDFAQRVAFYHIASIPCAYGRHPLTASHADQVIDRKCPRGNMPKDAQTAFRLLNPAEPFCDDDFVDGSHNSFAVTKKVLRAYVGQHTFIHHSANAYDRQGRIPSYKHRENNRELFYALATILDQHATYRRLLAGSLPIDLEHAYIDLFCMSDAGTFFIQIFEWTQRAVGVVWRIFHTDDLYWQAHRVADAGLGMGCRNTPSVDTRLTQVAYRFSRNGDWIHRRFPFNAWKIFVDNLRAPIPFPKDTSSCG